MRRASSDAAAAFTAAWRSDALGTYNVVDGIDVTWKRYIGDLARLVDAPPPKSMPLPVATTLAAVMESTWRALGRTHRPPLTREALVIVSSKMPVPIDRVRDRLGFEPPISYEEGMRSVADYLS